MTRRPAIVISTDEYNEAGGDVVVAPLTTRTAPSWLGDYRLRDWSDAGLRAPSVVRGKPTTLAQRILGPRIGRVSEADLAGVLAGVRAILG